MTHPLNDNVLFVYRKPNTFPSIPDVALLPLFVWTLNAPTEMERWEYNHLLWSVVMPPFLEAGWCDDDEWTSYVSVGEVWRHMQEELLRMVGGSLTASNYWTEFYKFYCHQCGSFALHWLCDGCEDELVNEQWQSQQPDADEDHTISNVAAIVTQTAFSLRFGRGDLLEEMSEDPYQTTVAQAAGTTGDTQHARPKAHLPHRLSDEVLEGSFPEGCVSSENRGSKRDAGDEPSEYSQNTAIRTGPNDEPSLHTTVYPERSVSIRAKE